MFANIGTLKSASVKPLKKNSEKGKNGRVTFTTVNAGWLLLLNINIREA
jgi:hypothetical protein